MLDDPRDKLDAWFWQLRTARSWPAPPPRLAKLITADDLAGCILKPDDWRRMLWPLHDELPKSRGDAQDAAG